MEPEEYSELLASLAPAHTVESVRPEQAVGRVLAEDIVAEVAVPAFPTSAMDGFALDRAAVESVRRGESVRVVGDVPAGHKPVPLAAGCAVRVMTGAQVPTSAEVVVPVEDTDAQSTGPAPQTIRVTRLLETVSTGRHIKAVGEDTQVGDTVMSSGQRLTAAGVGTLIMLGRDAVSVRAPLRVGIIVTGDELRTRPDGSWSVDRTGRDSAQAPIIHNSNLPMLGAAITSAGAVPVERTSSDDPEALVAILDALTSGEQDGNEQAGSDKPGSDDAGHRAERHVDLIITTGGISAGAFEVVRQALEAEHSSFGRLGMRPGAPQGHGTYGQVPLLHFPGTPQGAFLAFQLFARSLLEGRTLRTRWRKAVFAGPETATHPKAVTFLPGTSTDSGEIAAGQRARLRDYSGADVIIRIPRGTVPLSPGDIIAVLDC